MAFLRGLDEQKLIEPQRSAGGHRRYPRYRLRLAARVRTLLDEGVGLDAACRIVTLEDQLDEASTPKRRLRTRQASRIRRREACERQGHRPCAR